MNFTQYIFEHINNFSNKTAIFHRETILTYSELFVVISKVINKLDSLNLRADENIVLMGDNSFFLVISYFAIIGTGHVLVPIHPAFGEDNFKYVSQSCDTRVFFIQKKYWKRFNSYDVEYDYIFSDFDSDNTINIFNIDSEPGKIKEINEKEDLAIIFFTSGSTGIPKGVMLTHYNLIYNTNSIIEYLELKPSDRVMVVLPFTYCFGASLLHTHLRVGAQVVINNYLMFPGKVLKEINEKECTVFAGVPSVFSILLRRSALKKMKFPSLKIVQQAGGKLTNTFIKELKDTLTDASIFIMYGQTEATARLSYLSPELLDSKLGSIGKGIPGTKIEVLNDKGEPVKPGEVGEIVASGGNIMKGYWNDPEETAKTLKNGKLLTGDLGTVDEEGYIYLTDRIKEFIKVGGHRVGPKEIEDHISKLKQVVEVAIIGIFDELLGEAIKAFVSVTNSNEITENDIIKHCQQHFPPHKVPREVEFMKSLPKNISSKIDKYILKQREKEKLDQK